MTQRPNFSLIAVSLACLLVVPGLADTVKLKNGKSMEGTVLSEDATTITLEFEASRGIKDETRIAKADILDIEKEEPATRGWNELQKDLPTADLLGGQDYDRLLARVDAFTRAYPGGGYAGKAKKLADGLREERDRVGRGDLKLGGRWITKEEYQRDKFWIDGTIALQRMAQYGKSGRYIDAMRQYEAIQATYAGTTIHARAIVQANLILKKYAAVIQEAIVAQPLLAEQRAKRLRTLQGPERKASEDAQAAEDKAYLAKIEDEKKTGTKWISLSPYNPGELENARKTVETEAARIAAIDTKDAETVEILLREIDKAIGEGRLAGAATLVQQANQSLKKSPYLKSLDDRVKAELARINEEKRASEASLREAEKLAKAGLPGPISVPAGKPDEPDPVAEGASPIAKAVRNSQLGQRVAGGGTIPPHVPDTGATTIEPVIPTPPASATNGTRAAKETVAPADEGSVKGDVVGEAPSRHKSKARNPAIDYLLYGLGALLALALLGVGLAPFFRKKKTGGNTPQEPAAEEPAPEEEEIPEAEEPAGEMAGDGTRTEGDVDAEEILSPRPEPPTAK